ncbi:hypothetical protein D3C71_1782650 [compost metagenome]
MLLPVLFKASTKLINKAIPAALGPTDKNVVIGVGAPSYTSGTHTCIGNAEILKNKPAIVKSNAIAATIKFMLDKPT